jgi:hypothetical protein
MAAAEVVVRGGEGESRAVRDREAEALHWRPAVRGGAASGRAGGSGGRVLVAAACGELRVRLVWFIRERAGPVRVQLTGGTRARLQTLAHHVGVLVCVRR